MRRRQHDMWRQIPPSLRRFRSESWPPEGPRLDWFAAWQLWREARATWAEEHDWPPGGVAGWLDRISDEYRVRNEHWSRERAARREQLTTLRPTTGVTTREKE